MEKESFNRQIETWTDTQQKEEIPSPDE
uniref:Uncharacterized protein n=1 Tax=Arundo donax TaxID=35708 RepID=A0A0A9H394_ARUDO